MFDLRENYLDAREVVANELKEKYGLIESYKDHERLTLDSTNYSIHLTFIVPDGDEVYISEKDEKWFTGKSFKDLLFEKCPNDSTRTEMTKQIFKGSSRHPYSFKTGEIEFTYRAKLRFLQTLFPEKFS